MEPLLTFSRTQPVSAERYSVQRGPNRYSLARSLPPMVGERHCYSCVACGSALGGSRARCARNGSLVGGGVVHRCAGCEFLSSLAEDCIRWFYCAPGVTCSRICGPGTLGGRDPIRPLLLHRLTSFASVYVAVQQKKPYPTRHSPGRCKPHPGLAITPRNGACEKYARANRCERPCSLQTRASMPGRARSASPSRTHPPAPMPASRAPLLAAPAVAARRFNRGAARRSIEAADRPTKAPLPSRRLDFTAVCS